MNDLNLNDIKKLLTPAYQRMLDAIIYLGANVDSVNCVMVTNKEKVLDYLEQKEGKRPSAMALRQRVRTINKTLESEAIPFKIESLKRAYRIIEVINYEYRQLPN